MMFQMTVGAFVVTFIGGPLICALILRLPAKPPTLIVLGVGVVGAVMLALRMQQMGADWAVGSLVALWLAWVLAVGMVALAVRRHMTGPRASRWLTVIALLTTTLPWFGLATARLMV